MEPTDPIHEVESQIFDTDWTRRHDSMGRAIVH